MGQQPPRTPPNFNQGIHGGYGHMSQMSPMGYQVKWLNDNDNVLIQNIAGNVQMPYGYPPANGRERDYSRDRRDDYGRGGQRYLYNLKQTSA